MSRARQFLGYGPAAASDIALVVTSSFCQSVRQRTMFEIREHATMELSSRHLSSSCEKILDQSQQAIFLFGSIPVVANRHGRYKKKERPHNKRVAKPC